MSHDQDQQDQKIPMLYTYHPCCKSISHTNTDSYLYFCNSYIHNKFENIPTMHHCVRIHAIKINSHAHLLHTQGGSRKRVVMFITMSHIDNLKLMQTKFIQRYLKILTSQNWSVLLQHNLEISTTSFWRNPKILTPQNWCVLMQHSIPKQ